MFCRIAVALLVFREFHGPKIGVGLWTPKAPVALCATVPVTAMDEDDSAVAGQHDVRTPWKVLAVQPEPQPPRVKRVAHGKFRRGVFGLNPCHLGAFGVDGLYGYAAALFARCHTVAAPSQAGEESAIGGAVRNWAIRYAAVEIVGLTHDRMLPDPYPNRVQAQRGFSRMCPGSEAVPEIIGGGLSVCWTDTPQWCISSINGKAKADL
jgi:hypothetical protein